MSKNKTTAALIVAASLLTLTGCSGTTRLDRPLRTAAEKCHISEAVAYDGKSATMRIKSYASGTTYSTEQLACLLVETSAPSSIGAHMDATRSMDGMQEDQWEGLKARWTYHPDKGMNITISNAN